MTRTSNSFRNYPERAHRRAREERDRRLGKVTIDEPIVEIDDLPQVCDCTCNRLSNRQWFETHPLARSRLRDVVGDDLADAAQVLVTRKGHRAIEKTYIGEGTST
jgi:hypothetical protein